jgi:sortase A
MRWRRAVKPLAWTLAACVLLTVGWAGFMIADPFAGSRQQALQQQLFRQWRARDGHAPAAERRDQHAHRQHHGQQGRLVDDRSGAARARPASPRLATGQPFALLRIPALGLGWKFAIVQGTGLRQLALGPGHVPGTGLAGQRGNFVVAAHDVTAGNPFLHLGALHRPDRIYVTTRTHVYEYVVQSRHKVRYTDVGVELPDPGHPGRAPGRALITLITCTPVTLDFTPWRIVVTGHLVKTTDRPSP